MCRLNSSHSGARTKFLTLSGLLAGLIGVWQFRKLFKIIPDLRIPLNFAGFVFFIPIIFSLIFLVLAFLNHKQNKVILQSLDCLSQNKKKTTIFVLGSLIIFVFIISRTANLDDQVLNLAMSGIGLLFYGLALITLIFSIFIRIKSHKNQSDCFLVGTLLVITAAWLFMIVTRIGLQPDLAYWNVAGVPMMWVSLASIIVLILLLDSFVSWIKTKTNRKLDDRLQVLLEVLLVLAIWLAASFLWIKTPYSNSYFLLGPLLPDGHYWPASDARLMDLGGQYLIIGGKLETPYFTEKPFYALFLGILHFLFGQSYQVVTNVQILFLAFIPVLLYYLGKQLSGKLFGIALSIFAIVKEATAILFTYKISVSNSRLMMTELPSALLLIIVAILVFKWLKEDEPTYALPLLAGTTIGIASYVRSNNLVVLFVLIIFLVLTGAKNLRNRLPQIGFFILGVGLVILPWTVYSRITYGKDPITWKVQEALSTRFNVTEKEEFDETPGIPNHPLPDPTLASTNSDTFSTFSDSSTTETKQEETQPEKLYESKVSKVIGHFLNNQVKALFILPFQLYPARPTGILEQQYWHEPVNWSGEMPAEHIVAFVLNLVLISLGVSFAWKTFRWAGLVPLVIEMAYYLSNALVRTSGSRYLVAVDWVVYLYFLLGIWTFLQSSRLLSSTMATERECNKVPWKGFWISLSLSLIIGLSLPALNMIFPALYTNESKAEVANQLPMEKIELEVGITPAAMQTFYDKPDTVFLYGREIYPAFIQTDQVPGVQALTFSLLTPKLYEIIIPYGIEPDEPLPAGEGMIVIGCRIPDTNQVLAYLGYFVNSDQLIWSTSTTFNDICD